MPELVEYTLGQRRKSVVGDAIQYRILNGLILAVSIVVVIKSVRILWFNHWKAKADRREREERVERSCRGTEGSGMPPRIAQTSPSLKSKMLEDLQHPLMRWWRSACKVDVAEGVSIMSSALHGSILGSLRIALYGYKTIRGVSVLGGSVTIARLHGLEIVLFLVMFTPLFATRMVEVACGGWSKTPLTVYAVMSSCSLIVAVLAPLGFCLYGTVSAQAASFVFFGTLFVSMTRDVVCVSSAIRAMEKTLATIPNSKTTPLSQRGAVADATRALETLHGINRETLGYIGVVWALLIVFSVVPYLRQHHSHWAFLSVVFMCAFATVTPLAQDQQKVDVGKKQAASGRRIVVGECTEGRSKYWLDRPDTGGRSKYRLDQPDAEPLQVSQDTAA